MASDHTGLAVLVDMVEDTWVNTKVNKMGDTSVAIGVDKMGTEVHILVDRAVDMYN